VPPSSLPSSRLCGFCWKLDEKTNMYVTKTHFVVVAVCSSAGEQLCGEGPGCPGGRQVSHEPAVCPGCQEGQWDPGVH